LVVKKRHKEGGAAFSRSSFFVRIALRLPYGIERAKFPTGRIRIASDYGPLAVPRDEVSPVGVHETLAGITLGNVCERRPVERVHHVVSRIAGDEVAGGIKERAIIHDILAIFAEHGVAAQGIRDVVVVRSSRGLVIAPRR
jgi:hypothetical protein